MSKRKGGRSRRVTRGTILPVMGVLTVVSAAIGIHLGESAVGQIDPLYYRGAAPIPQDVTAQQRPLPRAAYAEASGWEQGSLAMAQDCGVDCPALHARVAGIAPSSLGIGEVAPLPSTYTSPEPALSEEPITVADAAPSSRTNRYLHYPVSQEPEPAPPSFSAPEPAPAGPSGRGEPDGM